MINTYLASTIIITIGLIIIIPISALALMFSTKILKLKKSSFIPALKVATIVGLLSYVFDIMLKTIRLVFPMKIVLFVVHPVLWLLTTAILILASLHLIKKIYKVKGGKMWATWGIWIGLFIAGFIITIIPIMIIAMVLVGILGFIPAV